MENQEMDSPKLFESKVNMHINVCMQVTLNYIRLKVQQKIQINSLNNGLSHKTKEITQSYY